MNVNDRPAMACPKSVALYLLERGVGSKETRSNKKEEEKKKRGAYFIFFFFRFVSGSDLRGKIGFSSHPGVGRKCEMDDD